MKTALTLAIIFLNVTSAQRVVGYYPQWVVDNLQIEEIEFDVARPAAQEPGELSSLTDFIRHQATD